MLRLSCNLRLCNLNELCKTFCIVNCHLSKHLSVHLNTCKLKTVHELRV